MIETLLHQQEDKTLEFKRDTSSLQKILQTIVSFANTAGGTIIIGVEDIDRKIVGLKNALADEERLSSSIADSISPQILPRIEIHNYRKKELIVVHVSCGPGPYYLKKKGQEDGVFVRLGSTNRVADSATLLELKRISMNVTFDELPCLQQHESDVDWNRLKELFFQKRRKSLSPQKTKSLGLLTPHMGELYPSNGAILMLGLKRDQMFLNALVRCARFQGNDREFIIDQVDFDEHLTDVIDPIIMFIKKHTKLAAKIGPIYREDIPEYPYEAIREAVQNAILHADYSMKGCTIQIAIFESRIEITNPGSLTHGMTLALAKSGVSSLRNHVIGKVFKELNLIEQWGSGIKRIINVCSRNHIKAPLFEELNNQFRVTLFSLNFQKSPKDDWENTLKEYLYDHKTIKPKEAAAIWKVSGRTARTRLKKLLDKKFIKRIGISDRDPHLCYALVSQG